jgi:hypothetical protein
MKVIYKDEIHVRDTCVEDINKKYTRYDIFDSTSGIHKTSDVSLLQRKMLPVLTNVFTNYSNDISFISEHYKNLYPESEPALVVLTSLLEMEPLDFLTLSRTNPGSYVNFTGVWVTTKATNHFVATSIGDIIAITSAPFLALYKIYQGDTMCFFLSNEIKESPKYKNSVTYPIASPVLKYTCKDYPRSSGLERKVRNTVINSVWDSRIPGSICDLKIALSLSYPCLRWIMLERKEDDTIPPMFKHEMKAWMEAYNKGLEKLSDMGQLKKNPV